jgi:hypothetical protein
MSKRKFKYFIKRQMVKLRAKRRLMEYENATKNIPEEELELFNKVSEIAKNNKSAIRFNPYSSEILIVLDHILVVLKNESVSIHNTSGFITLKLQSSTYELLVSRIEKEANAERLSLKYDAKKRIIKFINEIKN